MRRRLSKQGFNGPVCAMKFIRTSVAFVLIVVSGAVVLIAAPRFTNSMLRGASFIASGLGGVTNGPYTLLSSTNLAMPLTNWTAAVTNSFDGNGRFNLTNSMNPAVRQQFYALQILPASNDLWVPTCGAWLGAEVTNSTTQNFSNHEAHIGRQLDMPRFYHSVGDWTGLTSKELDYINAGRKICVSFKPSSNWADAAGGNSTVNAQLASLAQSVAGIKPGKIMIIVWHEPQNDVNTTTRTTNNYVAMWHNVRAIFDANGATNVIWCWCIQGPPNWRYLVPALWPGNAYVDWVAWDRYQGSASEDFIADETEVYNWFVTNSDATHDYVSKPWAWTEWGVGIGSFYPTVAAQTNTFNAVNAALNANQFPNVRMAAYYDDLASALLPGAVSSYSNFANSAYVEQQCPH
jgi:hypothetical protein